MCGRTEAANKKSFQPVHYQVCVNYGISSATLKDYQPPILVQLYGLLIVHLPARVLSFQDEGFHSQEGLMYLSVVEFQ
jgi:hypothetical protein